MDNIVVTMLGVRGAAPITGQCYQKYGGATSCVLVKIGGERIILDAGTGLLTAHEHLQKGDERVHLLLSHPHLDHLLGLPACALCFTETIKLAIYAVPRGGLSTLAQVEAVMSSPLWPVGVAAFTASVSFHDLVEPTLSIGSVMIETMEGCHPGGCTAFRLTCGGKSLVYATDFEAEAGFDEKLYEFAQNCDLFLCDGQYTTAEFAQRQGFGHSTWRFAAEMGARCQAAQTKIIHHELQRTDQELDDIARLLRHTYVNCTLARAGEEIIL